MRPLTLLALLAALCAACADEPTPDDATYLGAEAELWASRLGVPSTRAGALSDLIEGGDDALPMLAELLGNRSRRVRSGAALAMMFLRIEIPSRASVRTVVSFLESGDDDITEAIAILFRQSKAITAAHLQDLASVVRAERSVRVRLAALRTIKEHLLAGEVPGLLPETLQDASAEIRACGAEAVGNLASEGLAEPVLVVAALSHRDPGVRIGVLSGFSPDALLMPEETSLPPGRIGRTVWDAIRSCLKDKLVDVRIECAAAVGRIGIAQPGIEEPLRDLLADADPLARLTAAQALRKVGGSAMPVIAALMRLLDSPELDDRFEAVLELSAWGASASTAEGKLRQLAEEDSVEEVRTAAKQAVRCVTERK
jgi:HEAT repeat protein